MIELIKHMWKKHKWLKRYKDYQKRCDQFQEDFRTFKKGELKAKYKHPQREWALLIGEKYKLEQERRQEGF